MNPKHQKYSLLIEKNQKLKCHKTKYTNQSSCILYSITWSFIRYNREEGTILKCY